MSCYGIIQLLAFHSSDKNVMGSNMAKRFKEVLYFPDIDTFHFFIIFQNLLLKYNNFLLLLIFLYPVLVL